MRDPKAYRTMVHFLEERYQRLPSDALGGLLGELSFDVWNDGGPAEPAIAAEWERAVETAERELTANERESALRKAS